MKGKERFRGSLVWRFGVCAEFKAFGTTGEADTDYQELKRIAKQYKRSGLRTAEGLNVKPADLEPKRLSRAEAKLYRLKPLSLKLLFRLLRIGITEGEERAASDARISAEAAKAMRFGRG
jgi:hypothetical protein